MVQEANAESIELTNDAYLTIVYGEDKNKVKMKAYDVKVAQSSKNLLNGTIKGISNSAIANVVLAGVTSKVAQNIAGKALSSATLGRINSSIYDIMSDGQINIKEVAEDFVGSCTNAIDNIATDMGFPTPSSLYTALMPGGTGVISKDFSNLLAKKMDGENKKDDEDANNGNITVLKFKIITSDNESWGMDIPTRKTEKGFEIATAIGNQNKTKDFEVVLATNSKKGTSMYQIKNELETIRNLKVPFDVYINDKDVYEQYKLTNCLFSNLSFSPDGKNTIKCNMSIVEVPEWDIQMVKLDSTYKGKSTNGASASSGGSANKSGTGGSVKSSEAHTKTASTTVAQKFPYKFVNKENAQAILNIAENNSQYPTWQDKMNKFYKLGYKQLPNSPTSVELITKEATHYLMKRGAYKNVKL